MQTTVRLYALVGAVVAATGIAAAVPLVPRSSQLRVSAHRSACSTAADSLSCAVTTCYPIVPPDMMTGITVSTTGEVEVKHVDARPPKFVHRCCFADIAWNRRRRPLAAAYSAGGLPGPDFH